MSYDFYVEFRKPNIYEWNQYTILKFTKTSDESNYKRSIQQFYKRKQINKYWNFTEWFVPRKDNIPNNFILLEINFKLRKPFISKDDEQFWPKDNPICKDKVFKVPLMRASSWKGALRWVACKQFVDKFEAGKIDSKNWKEERNKLVRLFGTEKDNIDSWLNQVIAEKLKIKDEEIEKGFEGYLKDRDYVRENGNRRGYLFFYPTFFDEIGLDVITPHDRETKTPARGPILFETVPERTKGTFSLLYFPFDLIEKKGTDAGKEIEQDIAILKDAIPAMLEKYGFGAKISSGYGVAKMENIKINGKDCKTDWNKVLESIKQEYEK